MSWLRRLINTFRSGRVERDIDRELSFHIAERAEQLQAQGMSREEAARRARIQFGNLSVQHERTRDVDMAAWVDGALRNVRYAVRALSRTPGFTVTVVLTLALGVGANTAVFSAIDAVLLRPLPFPDSDRLVRILQKNSRTTETPVAPVRIEDWNQVNSTLEGITGFYTEDVSETSADLPEQLRRAYVAPRFVEVWGMAPALGRGFTEAEHQPGGPAAVMISDRYWRRRFGGDPGVLGQLVRVGATTAPIVGVMRASFRFPDRDVDAWFPRVNDQLTRFRQATWYTGIGRLKAGVTLEQARADLAAVQTRLGEQYPDSDRDITVLLEPLKETIVGRYRASLWLLFGGVTALLLITCTNVAALLLSRGTQRRPEVAIRLALGASRTTVAIQLLTETAVLALTGSAVGLAVTAMVGTALRSLARDIPRLDEISVDGRLLLYSLASACIVSLLCGLMPVIRTARDGLAITAQGAGRTQVSTRSAIQWLLVGTQIALSVTMLAGAGLLVRSLHELSRVDLGFEPARVLSFRMSGNYAEFGDYPALLRRIDTALEQLRALPGVEAAATSFSAPGVPNDFQVGFELVEAAGDKAARLVAESRVVSPEYFETLRIPLLEGTLCRRQPRGATELMVNRAFADRYLAGRPSVPGLHLANPNAKVPPGRIAGLVGDVRESGLDQAPGPTVYFCSSAQAPTPYFLVRTQGDPAAIVQAVRLKLKELEPLRAVYDIAPLETRIGAAFAQNRLRTTLLASFAATALAIACVGLYGTVSYAVGRRRRESALRLALGALRRDIVRQFLAQGLRVAGIACACGLVLSVTLARALSGMLYGVSPLDPATLSSVVGIVLVVTTLAALIPAMRAAFTQPMRALREE
jgi:putative ABC transport system permease protein